MSEDTTVAEKTKVVVRIRPLLAHELQRQSAVAAFAVDDRCISLQQEYGLKSASSQFDHVLGPDASQQRLYALVKECTESVLQGINSTVFAYGQTGSGKTHSMFGADEGDGAGVVPRVLQELFDWAQQQQHEIASLTAYCSFIQVYNEQVYDMLRDPHLANPLTIREDKGRETYVQGLSEYAMRSIGDCMELLSIAQHNRAIRETKMNQASSRSHSIFQITVQQKRRDESGAERTLQSKYNLVDLAGSEKWDTSINLVDAHVAELTNINLSLHTLGRCITALSKGTAHTHVPYRDSKLTRLLQDSLGGNAKTFLIATISPGSDCFGESLSTLRFASVASKVEVRATVNESHSAEHAIIAQLQSEIQQLRAALARLTDGEADGGEGKRRPADVILTLEQELQREKRNNSELTAKMNYLQKQVARAAEAGDGQACRPSERAVAAGATATVVNDWMIADLTEHLRHTTASMRNLQAAFNGFKQFEIEEDQLHERVQRIFIEAALEKNHELLGLLEGKSSPTRSSFPDSSHLATARSRDAGTHESGSDVQLADALKSARKAAEYPAATTASTSPVQLPQLPLSSLKKSQVVEPLDLNAMMGMATKHQIGRPLQSQQQHAQQQPQPQLSPVRDAAAAAATTMHRRTGKASPPGRSPAAGVTAGVRQRAAQPIHVPFRVRGRGQQENEWVDSQATEDDDARLQREIKQLRKKLQKEAELQEWMKRKEEQSMGALRQEEQRRKELMRAHEAREHKRQQRHQLQKRRLKEYYASVQAQLSDSTNFAAQLMEAARARVHSQDLDFYLSSTSSAGAGAEGSFFHDEVAFELSD